MGRSASVKMTVSAIEPIAYIFRQALMRFDQKFFALLDSQSLGTRWNAGFQRRLEFKRSRLRGSAKRGNRKYKPGHELMRIFLALLLIV